jgi:SpoVK/Ycf46/Vps4 family AAA+-type ATPase
LAVLATNLKSSLDAAFLRRLRFVINFPLPTAAQRREIWRRAFPVGAPVGELDYGRLARLGLTGGNIQTVALNAALASAEDGAVGMRQVLAAARAEFRKLQKPVSASDFAWTESEVPA